MTVIRNPDGSPASQLTVDGDRPPVVTDLGTIREGATPSVVAVEVEEITYGDGRPSRWTAFDVMSGGQRRCTGIFLTREQAERSVAGP